MKEKEFLMKANKFVVRKERDYIDNLRNNETELESQWLNAISEGDVFEENRMQKKLDEVCIQLKDEEDRIYGEEFDEEEFIIGNLVIKKKLNELFDEEEYIIGNLVIKKKLDELNDLLK